MVRYIHQLRLLAVGIENRYAHYLYNIACSKFTVGLKLNHELVDDGGYRTVTRVIVSNLPKFAA